MRAVMVWGASAVTTLLMSCSGPPSNPCDAIVIDDFKELVIVDEAVLRDARTLNATGGTWSFRHAVEAMVPMGVDAGEFVRSWLVEWVTLKTFNSYTLDRPNEARAGDMTQRVLCPWQKELPANGCNDDCSMCTANPPKLDLAKAPFRLIAIVNRLDLREKPDLSPTGESRLVFGLTSGPGDNPASVHMPGAVIFEYALPTSQNAKQWAELWHSLGKHKAFDDAYKAELEAHTNKWVSRGAQPSAQNGSAISQIRSNESALNWIWQLREFKLGSDGGLHLTGTRNTPAGELNSQPQLVQWVNANAAAIKAETHVVPASLLGGSADALIYRWDLPGVDEQVRKKFSQNTCNGCHTQENPSVDTAFHVSPFRTGPDRLSKFLYDPNNRAADDLTAREKSMRTALCTQ